MALNANALISVDYAKSIMNMASTNEDFDTLIENLINAASTKIEKACNRLFHAQDIVSEQVYVNQSGYATLNNFPIIRITKIAYGTRVGFEIRNTTMLRSIISIEKDRIALVNTTTLGVTTTTELEYDTYPTVALLVAAINLIAGYTATLKTNAPSTELTMRPGVDCASQKVSVDVFEPTSLYTKYRIDTDTGALGFVKGSIIPASTCWVDYRCGYETIPDDLQYICGQVVKNMWNKIGKDGSLSSKSVLTNDETITIGQRAFEDLEDYEMKLMEPYKAITLGSVL